MIETRSNPYKRPSKPVRSRVAALAAILIVVIGIVAGQLSAAESGQGEHASDGGSYHGAAQVNNERIVNHVSSETNLPEYSGIDIIEVDGNVPSFTEEERSLAIGTEDYSDFDRLGRAGSAIAVVGKETMPATKRQQLQFKPTGWVQAFYGDSIGLDHLYERSHLLAHSLTAENDNPNNLITGTEHMNDLMIDYETRVARYVERTGNHVLYRVSPLFEGDELVARGVQMEAHSLEDEGEGISFNVAIYNVQPGVRIDYLTGKSALE